MASRKAVRVWTRQERSPLAFGGGYETIATRAIPHLVAKEGKLTLYVIHNPKLGGYHVAEGTTGAFVGYDESADNVLARVCNDLRTADPKVVKQQLQDAHRQVKGARELKPAEFWSRFR